MSESPVDTPPLDLDLDSVEREYPRTKVAPKPYIVKWAGKVIQMIDPAELDWQDVIDVDDGPSLLKVAIRDEDKEHVETAPLPAWKLQLVFEGYMKHFGLGEPGKQRRGLLSS